VSQAPRGISRAGGLLRHNPSAPTRDCSLLRRELLGKLEILAIGAVLLPFSRVSSSLASPRCCRFKFRLALFAFALLALQLLSSGGSSVANNFIDCVGVFVRGWRFKVSDNWRERLDRGLLCVQVVFANFGSFLFFKKKNSFFVIGARQCTGLVV